MNHFVLHDFTEQTLKMTLNRIMETEGAVGGFIHVHPHWGEAQSIQEVFVEEDYDLVRSLFLTAKHLDKPLRSLSGLDKGRPCFVTVSQLDGKLGLDGKKPFPIISGGLSGLTKSLNREWPDVFCRHIDISPETDNAFAADMIIDELGDPDFHLSETGRCANGERCTLKTEAKNHGSVDNRHPDKDTVFLVTGGGRGITAECVCKIAGAFQCKFILLGRTNLTDMEPEWCRACHDEADLRSEAIAYLKREHHKPVPVTIRKMVHAVLSNREIKKTLSRINEYGGQAVYVSGDITDADALALCLDGACKKFGKIDGIIHGAGNLADKKIGMKTDEDFSLVFGTKIKGLENILHAINPEQIRFFLLFSSVSGYFGNAGQTDYALANEVLNKFSHCFKLFFPTSCPMAINWGPWESGMITETLKAFYEKHNICLIPVGTGADFCTQELRNADNHESPQILISGDLAVPGGTEKMKFKPLKTTRTIYPETNPFLQDHIIGGAPVLPATCAINWMVQSCKGGLPQGWNFIELQDFKVLQGIRFLNAHPLTCTVDIKSVVQDPGYMALGVNITSKSEKKLPVFHYSAILKFAKNFDPLPVYREFNLEPDGIIPQTGTALYGSGNFLFHGRSFMGVQKIININKEKITTLCRLPELKRRLQGQFAVNSFNPYIMDIQLHCCLIWSKKLLSIPTLPLEIGRVQQFGTIDFNENFYVSGEIKSYTKSNLLMDIIAHDQIGKIYHKLTNVDLTFKNY